MSGYVRTCNTKLRSFTGDKIETRGIVKLEITLKGNITQHDFIVTEGMETDILVGANYLEENDITLKMRIKKLEVNGHHVNFINLPSPLERNCKIKVAKTTVIEANTVTHIMGKMEDFGKKTDKSRRVKGEYSGILEPHSLNGVYRNTASRGIVIPRTAVYSQQGEVAVRCMNLNDQPVTLTKNSSIAVMQPLDCGWKSMMSCVKGIQIDKNQKDGDVKNSTNKLTEDESFSFSDEQGTNQHEEWTRERLFKELRLDVEQTDADISKGDLELLREVMWKNRKQFSRDKHDIGTGCKLFEAKIDLKRNFQPQWVPCRPTPYKQREALNKELKKLLQAGVVEDCNDSMWQSPAFLVKKPGRPGEWRWVLDARRINSQSIPDDYQLPNINHVVDTIGGCKYYSTLDLSQSFHQINLDVESRPITAFSINGRRLMYAKMLMGHCNSAQQFSRCMRKLLETIPIDELIAFLDDILLASNTVKEHIERLDCLLTRFAEAEMKLTPSKCYFLKKEVKYVGLIVSEQGIRMTDERIKAVEAIQAPKTIKETQTLLGFLNYNRKFVKNFATKAWPIYKLLEKENRRSFRWTEECDVSLEDIKKEIAKGITLRIPDIEDPYDSYEVTLDASNKGLGAELTQMIDGKRRLLAYFSKAVPRHKKTWGATKLEFLALCSALEHWKIYIKGTRKFKVVTDCESLLNLDTIFTGKGGTHLIRKLQRLAGFNFSVDHIDGENNSIADFLSRYLYRGVEKSTQTASEERKDQEKGDKLVVKTKQLDLVTDKDVEDWRVRQHGRSKEQTDWLQVVKIRLGGKTELVNMSDDKFIPTYKTEESGHCTCPEEREGGRITDLEKEERVRSITAVNAVEIEKEDETVEISHLSREKIIEEQNKDPVIKEVMKWVRNKERPQALQAIGAPQELVILWKQFTTLLLDDGILMRNWFDLNSQKNTALIVIPEMIREEVMQLCHKSRLVSHPGVENSYVMCRRYYYWPKMREDFELYIAACTVCSNVKQPQSYLKAPLKHMIYHQFNDCIVIDHIVPSRERKTKRGNRYILTITDMWSGYCVAVACKTQEAKETFNHIKKEWLLRFGVPKRVVSDQASGFTSTFFNSVLAMFDIQPSLGMAYSCRSTSKAERTNKRVNQALRAALRNERLGEWDLYLDYVVFALNSLKSRHTGYSANKLLFGKEVNTPMTILMENQGPENKVYKSYARQAYDLYWDMKRIIHKVRKNAATDFGYADNQWNKKLKGPFFNDGDFCYTLLYRPQDCPKHKFAYRWSGPHQVIKVVNERLYVVKFTDTGEERAIILNNMKHYKINKYSPEWIRRAAEKWKEQSQCNDNRTRDPEETDTTRQGEVSQTENNIETSMSEDIDEEMGAMLWLEEREDSEETATTSTEKAVTSDVRHGRENEVEEEIRDSRQGTGDNRQQVPEETSIIIDEREMNVIPTPSEELNEREMEEDLHPRNTEEVNVESEIEETLDTDTSEYLHDEEDELEDSNSREAAESNGRNHLNRERTLPLTVRRSVRDRGLPVKETSLNYSKLGGNN